MRICDEGPRLVLVIGASQVSVEVHALTGAVGISSVGLCNVLGGMCIVLFLHSACLFLLGHTGLPI